MRDNNCFKSENSYEREFLYKWIVTMSDVKRISLEQLPNYLNNLENNIIDIDL